MALIVQKFGGTSVAGRERIFNVARIIAGDWQDKNRVVVVVSAQGDLTDRLLARAREVSSSPCPREVDMLISSGEQVSAALLCMALGELGVRAVSLTGWQAGVITDRCHTTAHVRRLDGERIECELDKNQVVVVTGFQGVDCCEDITTLGRGGSDTSAVALACALGAQVCRIYTDVSGVFTADPRLVPSARRLPQLSFDEMLELAAAGAQVLHGRSVELAKKYGLQLEVLSSLEPQSGTGVGEECCVEGYSVKSVALDTDIVLITLTGTPERTDLAFRSLSLLAQNRFGVRLLVQSDTATLRFTVSREEQADICRLLEEHRETLHFQQLTADENCACLSVVGTGLKSDVTALPRMLEALSDIGVGVLLCSAGEVRASAVIPRNTAETAVHAVHDAFFVRWAQ